MSAALESLSLRAGRWEFVNSLSGAGFAVRNFGVKTVRGRVPVVDAWVDVDAAGRPSAVRATLDLAAIDTGNARRDKDLRAPRLLDTPAYPLMTFDGPAPKHLADAEWVLPGLLAARGTSVELTLQATVTPGRDGLVRVRAVTALDRRALGVTAPRFLIGRRIEISLDASFTPPH